MTPSEKKLIAELKTEIKRVYDESEERPLLTVRYIRDKVTNRLGLADGFFVQDEWKDKSKKLIQSYAVCTPDLRVAFSRGLSLTVCSKN